MRPQIARLRPAPSRHSAAWRRPAWASTGISNADGVIAPDAIDEDLIVLRLALEHYDVMECIERGGQGVVYRARQRASSRVVALKVLLDGPLANDRQRFRFEREIELISRLRHPNIVTLYDSGAVRGRLFYTMEYVDGLAINDYALLHDLSPRQIVKLMVPVCRAIQYAHQNGVIHRDLKPAHIVVDDNGQPRVFDFGLAKDLDDDAIVAHSCSGQVVGTLPYLSPEQAGGCDGKADVRSDVYALGIVIYELLTDLFPYPVDGTPEQVWRTIVGTEPLPVRKALALGGADNLRRSEEINRDLEAILQKTLAKSKDERYQSAGELADDLERYLSGEAVTARGKSYWYVVRKTIRKHRVEFGVATAFALTLMTATVGMSMAWLEARAQRDAARNGINAASDWCEFAFNTLEQKVRPLPGGGAVRDYVVDRFNEELPRLGALAQSDPAFVRLSATLLEKQGDLASDTGQRDSAANSYRQLIAQLSAVSDDDMPAAEKLRRLATAHRKLAGVIDQPEANYLDAISFAEQALQLDGATDSARFVLATTLVDYASRLVRNGDFERALELIDRAITLMPFETEAAVDSGWLRLNARAKSERSIMLSALGRGSESFDELGAALMLRERIAAANYADIEAKYDLLCAYHQMCQATSNCGANETTLDLLTRAAEIGRELSQLDPSVTRWDRHRCITHYKLALIQLDLGDLETARENFNTAMRMANRAGITRATSMEACEDLAFLAILEGRLDLANGDWDCALTRFGQARELRCGLVRSNPSSPSYQRQLTAACYWQGLAYRKLGRLDEALAAYEGALEFYQNAVMDGSTIVYDEINSIHAQVNLAAFLLVSQREDDDDRARTLLASASDELTKLEKENRLVIDEQQREQIRTAIRGNGAILNFRNAKLR